MLKYPLQLVRLRLPVRQLSDLTTKFIGLGSFSNLNYDQLQSSLRTDSSQCEQFWKLIGEQQLNWMQPFHTVSDCDLKSAKIAWYLGGKLNASANCIDRHLATRADQTALIWERDEPGNQVYITYKQLHAEVCRIANLLLQSGLQAGDTAVLYMPTGPPVVYCMLACARIGVAHSVVFAGFSAEALAARIQDVGAKVVITTDQAIRGGKTVELKRTVDAAVKSCPMVERVFVSTRTGASVPMFSIDVPLEKNAAACSADCAAEPMDSEQPLFVLYTSGSTGKPKGLVHSTAGYLVYTSLTHRHVFDYRPGQDIFGCVADVGWITGHSYVVYGPLVNGGTTLLFESTPAYPDVGRYWETAERLGLTHIYLSPTSLRMLLRYSTDFVTKYDLSRLRVLGCVGEPLNHEAWEWYHRWVGGGQRDIADTWWQTETGGVCIAPRPSAEGAPILPAMPMRPFYGLEPVLMDPATGAEVAESPAEGHLCMRRPWPGMARSIWGDHKRFAETYYSQFPGLYFTGDGASRDAQGFLHITGRVDDVINVTGHRLGTAEIEDALDSHPAVSETAVIGYPHKLKGEAVYAFVILKDGVSIDRLGDLRRELKRRVRDRIAAYAVPEKLLFTDGLPKTRSGKIMRRILKRIAAEDYDSIGDISTLADPSVVEALKQHHDLYQRHK
uniref:Acetyl-coenzyme A synthetase n=2 Tax=Macrostomum lignano TaxID=282301 RepID=A0A1I8HFB6_9PLAT